ncbi:MAG TPA: FAD-dependent oxidoreductase, partial [Acidimicrobiia bacterium]|nr:FAD-dependent oxidoreductase [Acidimicrobiia bacterium]
TVEERGFDTRVTAGAVRELLDAASELLPGVSELELAEARAGLRPGTPDNAPIIGAVPGRADVLVATGHFRNGILLTPVTADAVADLAVGSRGAPVTAPFTADRFS